LEGEGLVAVVGRRDVGGGRADGLGHGPGVGEAGVAGGGGGGRGVQGDIRPLGAAARRGVRDAHRRSHVGGGDGAGSVGGTGERGVGVVVGAIAVADGVRGGGVAGVLVRVGNGADEVGAAVAPARVRVERRDGGGVPVPPVDGRADGFGGVGL